MNKVDFRNGFGMLGDGELKLESINIQNLSRVGQILDEPPKRSEENHFGDP